jgi:hypothetical protein
MRKGRALAVDGSGGWFDSSGPRRNNSSSRGRCAGSSFR